jgi:hypothetical protein
MGARGAGESGWAGVVCDEEQAMRPRRRTERVLGRMKKG